MPDVWQNGSVSGLRARGGFVIESMAWKGGKITKVVIKSTLGGNCRIRSYSPMMFENKTELKKANGENDNTFYQTAMIQKPLISEKAILKGLDLLPTNLYDISTKAGQGERAGNWRGNEGRRNAQTVKRAAGFLFGMLPHWRTTLFIFSMELGLEFG